MAINQTLAEQPIPVGYSATADGEYVIGGEAWGDMANVMLYDNETYRSTSLIIPQKIYLEKGVQDSPQLLISEFSITDFFESKSGYKIIERN